MSDPRTLSGVPATIDATGAASAARLGRRPGAVNASWERRFAAALRGSLPVLVLLGAAGAALVLAATARHGPALSPDSFNYLAAARDLRADGDLENLELAHPTGRDYVNWPPLYPALLAVGSLGPGDPADAARYLNAALYSAVVVVAGLWLRRVGVDGLWLLLGCLAVLLSYPLLQVAIYAWSETAFILWLLAWSLALAAYLDGGGRRLLLAAAACAALACLTRYVGVVPIGLGVVLPLAGRRRPLSRRLGDAVLYGAIAAVPCGLWVLRNRIVSSTLTGTRGPSFRSFEENVRASLDTLALWFFPEGFLGGRRDEGIVVALAAVAGLAALLAARSRPARALLLRTEVVILAAFVAAYTAYLIGSATRVSFDQITTRLLSPIAVPMLLLLVVSAVAAVRAFERGPWESVAHAAMAAAAVAWLLVPLGQVERLVERARAEGAGGYATNDWVESDLLAFVRTQAPDGLLYSNYPGPVGHFAGRPTAMILNIGPARFAGIVEAEPTPVYLAWFTIDSPGQGFPEALEALRNVVELTPLLTGADGTFFRVTAKPATVGIGGGSSTQLTGGVPRTGLVRSAVG